MSLALAFPLFLLPAAANAPETTAPPPSVEKPAEPRAANAIFAELLGNGLLYSLNYERFVAEQSVGLRAGASFFTRSVSRYGSSGNLTIVSFPLIVSYYSGWQSHKVQLGIGATILHTKVATDSQGIAYEGERAGTTVAPTVVFGYRYVPADRGFSFGVGFTPLLRASKLLPWGGASAGYVF